MNKRQRKKANKIKDKLLLRLFDYANSILDSRIGTHRSLFSTWDEEYPPVVARLAPKLNNKTK